MPEQVAALEPVVVGGASHGSSGPGLTTRVAATRSGPGRSGRRSASRTQAGVSAVIGLLAPYSPGCRRHAIVHSACPACSVPRARCAFAGCRVVRRAAAARRPSTASPPAAPASPASPARVPPRLPATVERPAPPPRAPWWRDRVFYEVFVRSFADSDGDGIGDLRGLTERLDYLNDGDPATTDDLGRDRALADADRRVPQLPRLRRHRLPDASSRTTARPRTSRR